MALEISSLYFSLSLLIFLSMRIHAYTPLEHFSINCGSSSNSSDDDGRKWSGDTNSNILFEKNPSINADSLTQSDCINTTPYKTARISQSEFTYSFSVAAGQKFLRLFFYPSSYNGFERYNAVFSVKSGSFTLLKNFNASLTADAYKSCTIFREYMVNVDDGQRLNLTFTPGDGDSYALINGIEVLSMPTDFYYNESMLVGSFLPYRIGNHNALETKYRINVGGASIASESDTGMFRSWDSDEAYVTTISRLPFAISDRALNFTRIPIYTAPDVVYETGRFSEETLAARSSSLIWEFPVDSGFNYTLRLHFCEIDRPIQRVGDRVFDIYIAENLATRDGADIILWSGGWEAPIYRDYTVPVVSKNQKMVNLSLELQPRITMRNGSAALLSGLEIFKISEGSNLAGPNPDPLTPVTPHFLGPNANKPPSGESRKIIPYSVSGVISGIILLSVISFLIFRRRLAQVKIRDKAGITSLLPSDLCRYFTLGEIRAATNKFDENSIIGVGGFGNVYKGHIDKGATPVAIKRLNAGSQQGLHEFKTEIEMLSQLSHRHLVSLLGYCNDKNEMILVYDFMARGTLRDHLYDSNNPPLSWNQRLQICLGAAKGLQYLHGGAKHNIIHRDVKTTNILLDEKWVAKVSDFGLSKIGPSGISKSYVTTVVKGSIGYLDPEYYMDQRLTEKSDVYSFGVVLLEVLCGRPPLLRAVEKPQISLVEWARKCHSEGVIDEMIDPFLKGKISEECLNKFVEMAVSCVLQDGNLRPSMSDVVGTLEFALELQERKEDGSFCGIQNEGTTDRRASNFNTDAEIEEECSVSQVGLVNQTAGQTSSDWDETL